MTGLEFDIAMFAGVALVWLIVSALAWYAWRL